MYSYKRKLTLCGYRNVVEYCEREQELEYVSSVFRVISGGSLVVGMCEMCSTVKGTLRIQ